MSNLYFDHAAATPMLADIRRVWSEVAAAIYANPSALHEQARVSAQLIAQAQETIAAAFPGTVAAEWVFTSGGTESNNLAIFGATRAYKMRGRHVVSLTIEHSSVNESLLELLRTGYEVTFVPVNRSGVVDMKALLAAIREDTVLVSVQAVNSEVGAMQPIGEIANALQAGSSARRRPLLHVDGVQALGKSNVSDWLGNVDLCSFSAHKIGGPRGVGLLYVRSGIKLSPLLFGGGQQQGLRPGTEDVPGIVATARAVRLAVEVQRERAVFTAALRDKLCAGLKQLQQYTVTSTNAGSPFIVHLTMPGMKAEVIVHELERRGIFVGTQSACSSKTGKPSRVLEALALPRTHTSSGIRISFGPDHTQADIDTLIQAFKEVATIVEPVQKEALRSVQLDTRKIR